MKHIIKLSLATAMVAVGLNATAQLPPPQNVFASGGTDVGTTISYAIVTGRSKNNGTPVVTSINATSDKGGSKVQFYTTGTPARVTHTNSTTTIPVDSTNDVYAASGVVIIRHHLTDTYEKRILTTSTGTTNLVLTAAPGTTTVPNDLIYLATTAGTIPLVTNTLVATELNLSLTGDGIYSGQQGKPMLMEVDGTSAVQLNAVAGKFAE